MYTNFVQNKQSDKRRGEIVGRVPGLRAAGGCQISLINCLTRPKVVRYHSLARTRWIRSEIARIAANLTPRCTLL